MIPAQWQYHQADARAALLAALPHFQARVDRAIEACCDLADQWDSRGDCGAFIRERAPKLLAIRDRQP